MISTQYSSLRLLMFMLLVSLSAGTYAQRVTDFNFDWEFYLSQDSTLSYKKALKKKSSSWRKLDLPHDWVIENEYDSAKTADTYNATGWIYGRGIGWYKKSFNVDLSEKSKVFVLFDGVYNNAEVWINGKSLGVHNYGYSPFYHDLSEYLNPQGQKNIIVVKVDHTRYADSRWYTGAGIYRNVKLIQTQKTHIPIWGTFITTPVVSQESATVNAKISVANESSEKKKIEIKTVICDINGNEVVEKSSSHTLSSGVKEEFSTDILVSNPDLWTVNNPNLYTAKTILLEKGKVIDQYNTTFGIRSIRFDKETGFYLNGENMKIKGVCLHHDAGLVGTAVPKDVWRRRLTILKNGGTNAIRIAHNPGSEEFLDLCDELGLMVQDEFFDEWDYPKDKRFNQEEKHNDYVSRGYNEYFHANAEKDLKSVILAHRNHPSIIQWSIGNEIEWTYNPRYRNITGYFNMEWSGNYFWEMPPISPEEIKQRYLDSEPAEYVLAETAKKLAGWTREMDTTRPVISNCILPSASHITGYADALDIVGYSYRRVLYDYGHKNYPQHTIMGTENLAQYHEWKAIEERPFIAGTFLWTGADYMGEVRDSWPVKVQPSGMLDMASFEKGSYHMMKTLWSEEPHIFIGTQTLEKSLNKINEETGYLEAKDPERWKTALWVWHDLNTHWNYSKGDTISVEVYSNLENLELFINGESLGARSLSEFEDHIYKWAVPYQAGVLEVVGVKGFKTIKQRIVSAEQPRRIQIVSDRKSMTANGYDAAHIIAQFIDANGNPVQHQDQKLSFEVKEFNSKGELIRTVNTEPQVKEEGLVSILGIDNGAKDNVQYHKTNTIITDQGRCVFIVQSNRDMGSVQIKATSAGIVSNTIQLEIK